MGMMRRRLWGGPSGRRMRRPYQFIRIIGHRFIRVVLCRVRAGDQDDAMHVIRHHDERVQSHPWKMDRDRSPHSLRRHSGSV